LTKCWEIVATEADKWILQMQQGTWPSLMALYRDQLSFVDECQRGVSVTLSAYSGFAEFLEA